MNDPDLDGHSRTAEGAARHAVWIFARERTADLARVTQEWMRSPNLDEARRIAQEYRNCLPSHNAGHMFEFMEALRFNAVAARIDDAVRAVTTASQGHRAAAADLILYRGDTVVEEIQAKFYESNVQGLNALRAEKYDGMQRLVPADQVDDIRAKLGARLGRNPEGIHISAYEDVDRNLTGELHHGRVKSGGLTREDVRRASEDPIGWLRGESATSVVNETLRAAAAGAAAGAVLGAAAEGLRMALDDPDHELSVAETVSQIATTSATAGLRFGAVSGLAKVVEIGARNSAVLSPLAQTTAPMAIASSVLTCAQAAFDFAHGSIDREELVRRCGATAIQNSTAWAYGVVGQAVIPIPLVGVVVGSTVGYVTSAVVMEGFKLARVAAEAANAAEAQLQVLEEEILHAVKRLEEHRLTLEAIAEQEALQFETAVLPLLDEIERGLASGHDDATPLAALVRLNLELGTQLDWSTLPEFDEFMADPDTVLAL